jgi:hypothetical protein
VMDSYRYQNNRNYRTGRYWGRCGDEPMWQWANVTMWRCDNGAIGK